MLAHCQYVHVHFSVVGCCQKFENFSDKISWSLAAMDESIEQTLHIARSCQLFRIPPRGPSGHVSGEWRVTDKRRSSIIHTLIDHKIAVSIMNSPIHAVFEGRMRVMSKGEHCEILFEAIETNSGTEQQLFACAPVPYGKRITYIEPGLTL